MWAVLGGSGFEKFDSFQLIEEMEITTPFGGIKRTSRT